MKKSMLLIATIITLTTLMSVTVFADSQVGTACSGAICCSGNKSTITHMGTQVWNSSFVQTFEMKINGSSVAFSDKVIQAWLEINNTAGTLTNFSMTNVTSNWTLAVTGMNARTGTNYVWNIIANNSTGNQLRCMAAPLKFNLTRATATSTLTAYNINGQAVTSLTAPVNVRIDCVQTHSTYSSETILPSLSMTLTYPAGWTGSTSNPTSYADNTYTTLTPIGAGTTSYVFTCTYTTNENYSTGTDGTLTFNVNPGGNVIVLPGQSTGTPIVTMPVELSQLWTMLQQQYFGIPLWIILIVAIVILANRKKLKF